MISIRKKSKSEIYDALRKKFPHISPPDLLVITPGVKALIKMGGPNAPMEVLDMTELGKLIREFDEFSEDNDPWGEHDFGAIEFRGQKLFWKIDDYSGQPEPYRYVMTVMVADEY